MKTILAPVDLSPISDRVVGTAADLAQSMGARLILIHVISLPTTTPEFAAVIEPFAGTIQVAEHQADLALGRWQALLQSRSIPSQIEHFTGLPHLLIPALAEKFEADLVVMGSHGHTALYDLLVGTTTRDVLAKTRCPVVVVPARAAKKPVAEATSNPPQLAN